MSIGVIISLIAAIAGSGGLGAIVTALVNAHKNNADSEVRAREQFTAARAQFTEEFNALIAAQNAHMERQDIRTDSMIREIQELKGEVRMVREEQRRAEAYIDRLIVGISNGTIPPIPERE